MKRSYTDEDRARVRMYLEMHGGAVKPAARDSGVPIATVRDWRNKWDREGVPEPIQAALPAIREDTVEQMSQLRDKALIVAEQKLDLDKTSAKDAVWIAAVMTDKIRLIQGQPTSRTETSSVGSLPIEEVRELFSGFAQGIVEAAKQRSSEISSVVEEEPTDAEWEPVQLRALPSPS